MQVSKAVIEGDVDTVVAGLVQTGDDALELQQVMIFDQWAQKKINDQDVWLMQACKYGHTAIVKVLLALRGERRANVFVKGLEPLHVACWRGHTEIVALLLGLGGGRRTPVLAHGFELACERNHVDIVKLLLAETGDRSVNVHRNNAAAFRMACQRNSIEVVRHLLTLEGDRRIDVGAKNNAAFKVACIQGNTGVVRQLLSLTGDRTVSVVSGTDASDNGAYLAMVGGHMDTVREILQQRGEHEAFTFTSTDMRRLMQAQEQVQTVVDEPEPEMLMV
jgi:ankyrin repeat protein